MRIKTEIWLIPSAIRTAIEKYNTVLKEPLAINSELFYNETTGIWSASVRRWTTGVHAAKNIMTEKISTLISTITTNHKKHETTNAYQIYCYLLENNHDWILSLSE